MEKNELFTLNQKALIALVVSSAFPFVAEAAAGKVEFSVGNATAIGVDGKSRALIKGSEIESGDTIQTVEGRLQVRFADGGYISFQPNTTFKVEEYNYNGKTDGSEKSIFRLVEGGLRAITGAIGHVNRPNYKMNTPVATIGIRGTEYVAVYHPGSQQLYISTVDGALYVKNDNGDMVLFKGQSGEVNGAGKPERSDGQAGVAAQGPTDTNVNQSEQTKEANNNTIFIVNDQYNSSGNPIAIASDTTSPTLVAMQSYASANAFGEYRLVNDSFNKAGPSTDGYYQSFKLVDDNETKISRLNIIFGTGQIISSIAVEATHSDVSFPSTDTVQFRGTSGSLIRGTTGFTLGTLTTSGELHNCTSNCVLNAVGTLTGSTAQQANITYQIGAMSNSNPQALVVNGNSVDILVSGGTANFNAPVRPSPVNDFLK